MSFTFKEDTIRKGSEPFTTGVYTFLIEDFYIAERTAKAGNRYFNININLLEPETNRKLFISGFNALYGGKIDDNGVWDWKTKDGKDMYSVEQLNSFLYIITKQAFASSDIQTKVPFAVTKVKEFNDEIEVNTIKDLIGKEIKLGIKVNEHGYEKDNAWVESTKYTLEAIFDSKTEKTAFELSQNKPANHIKDFREAFGSDYVEPLRDKDLIAKRDKYKMFEGASIAEDTDTTSSTAPAASSNAIDLL